MSTDKPRDQSQNKTGLHERPVSKAIYAFFLFHMLMFGVMGFFMAYAEEPISLAFIFIHGGLAVSVYLVFFVDIFGRVTVGWIFIDAALGLFGIYAQIDWILELFGKQVSDYPVYLHIMPFTYYIMYTFLLHQALLDLTGSRAMPQRQSKVNIGYVLVSLAGYAVLALN